MLQNFLLYERLFQKQGKQAYLNKGISWGNYTASIKEPNFIWNVAFSLQLPLMFMEVKQHESNLGMEDQLRLYFFL